MGDEGEGGNGDIRGVMGTLPSSRPGRAREGERYERRTKTFRAAISPQASDSVFVDLLTYQVDKVWKKYGCNVTSVDFNVKSSVKAGSVSLR